ncbi:hypothetical protein AKJ56_02125 [candidate division MSBL1 archaeon SCGC-AAA382N08]|uniref:Uncharacterized protein n=1 Tax=candidate division MSBL1 archaeon SCGC-AAA382N08 TaxID=1698285 RepID=A0A133VN81_9EURY|nr:hypothetical protein AKJ56_02125 [candidate division MSBL1 archaeon SCGC-AAA382N08]
MAKYFRIGWEEGCECKSAEPVGMDGGMNEYYKCKNCDGIIIKKGEGDIQPGKGLRETGEPEIEKDIMAWNVEE